MSQTFFKWRDKLGGIVHKAIFVKVFENGKYIEVAQRYIDTSKSTFKLNKDHEYPISPKDWCRQSKNRFIQYRDYEAAYKVYTLWEVASWMKPNKVEVSAKEFAYNKVAQVASAVVQGGQLNAGLVLLVITLAAGIMGGILLGYFGLPAVTGQHLVANAVPK